MVVSRNAVLIQRYFLHDWSTYLILVTVLLPICFIVWVNYRRSKGVLFKKETSEQLSVFCAVLYKIDGPFDISSYRIVKQMWLSVTTGNIKQAKVVLQEIINWVINQTFLLKHTNKRDEQSNISVKTYRELTNRQTNRQSCATIEVHI